MTDVQTATNLHAAARPATRRAGAGNSLLKYGFVGPTLLFLIAMNVFPLIYNIVLSFTNADLMSDDRAWVGGANYARIFTNPDFAAAIRNTGLFVLAAVSAELVLGFVLALCLRDSFRGKTIVLTLLLIPMMLPPAVMGYYWKLILDEGYGILNQMLSALGLGRPAWGSPDLKPLSVLLIDIWMWTPFTMLISLAGLNAIPKYIYEAAEIDRASRWTVFRRITLPMCAPLLFLAVLFRTTDALKQFDLVMQLAGSDLPSARTLSVQAYKVIFRNRNVGLGSAYSIVILVIVMALATVFVRYIDYTQRKQGRAQP